MMVFAEEVKAKRRMCQELRDAEQEGRRQKKASQTEGILGEDKPGSAAASSSAPAAQASVPSSSQEPPKAAAQEAPAVTSGATAGSSTEPSAQLSEGDLLEDAWGKLEPSRKLAILRAQITKYLGGNSYPRAPKIALILTECSDTEVLRSVFMASPDMLLEHAQRISDKLSSGGPFEATRIVFTAPAGERGADTSRARSGRRRSRSFRSLVEGGR
jgi:hypothetical protein